jgi:hypothetical protein
MVDATIVRLRKRRNSRDENEEVKGDTGSTRYSVDFLILLSQETESKGRG